MKKLKKVKHPEGLSYEETKRMLLELSVGRDVKAETRQEKYMRAALLHDIAVAAEEGCEIQVPND